MDYENTLEESAVMQLSEEAGIDENWLRDFKMGIAMGLCLSSQFESKADPIAYLYGHVAKEGETPTHIIGGVGYVGAVLPKLPPDGEDGFSELDSSSFPYAAIFSFDFDDDYYLLAFPKQLSYNTATKTLFSSAEVEVPWFVVVGEPPIWWNTTGSNETYSPGDTEFPLPMWSNFDILDENRKIALAASDPIPVYE